LQNEFDHYDVYDSEPSNSKKGGFNVEAKLENDIDQLLESKFFKEPKNNNKDLELNTEGMEDELEIKMDGFPYSEVEKGVGADFTTRDEDEEEEVEVVEGEKSKEVAVDKNESANVEAAVPLDLSTPEAAPATVVAAEGTTGVEAKLSDPTTESAAETSGFL
jgi:hypothetical protein